MPTSNEVMSRSRVAWSNRAGSGWASAVRVSVRPSRGGGCADVEAHGANSPRIAWVCWPRAGTAAESTARPRRSRAARGARLAARRRHGQTAQVRMSAEAGDIVDGAEGDAGGLQQNDQRGVVVTATGSGHDGIERLAIGDPVVVRLEPGIGGERRLLQHGGAELAPLALVLDRDQQRPAVGALEHAVGRDRGMGEAESLRAPARRSRDGAAGTAMVSAVASNSESAIAALSPRALAPIERFEDGGVGVEAADDIGERDADAAGRLGRAGHGGQAALGLDEQVVGLAVGIGAGVAIAADRAGDESRMAPAQLRRVGSRRGRRRPGRGSG